MKTQKHEIENSALKMISFHCVHICLFGCLFVINTSINPPFCSFYFVPLYCMPERFENISSLRLQSYNSERISFLPHGIEPCRTLLFYFKETTMWVFSSDYTLIWIFKLDFRLACRYQVFRLKDFRSLDFSSLGNMKPFSFRGKHCRSSISIKISFSG